MSKCTPLLSTYVTRTWSSPLLEESSTKDGWRENLVLSQSQIKVWWLVTFFFCSGPSGNHSSSTASFSDSLWDWSQCQVSSGGGRGYTLDSTLVHCIDVKRHAVFVSQYHLFIVVVQVQPDSTTTTTTTHFSTNSDPKSRYGTQKTRLRKKNDKCKNLVRELCLRADIILGWLRSLRNEKKRLGKYRFIRKVQECFGWWMITGKSFMPG